MNLETKEKHFIKTVFDSIQCREAYNINMEQFGPITLTQLDETIYIFDCSVWGLDIKHLRKNQGVYEFFVGDIKFVASYLPKGQSIIYSLKDAYEEQERRARDARIAEERTQKEDIINNFFGWV